jgi:ParB family transcriptional regulator, chromosome partitioning protein
MEKRALGRGLSALIPTKETDQSVQVAALPKDGNVPASGESVIQIAVNKIKTNKYQPRVEFNQDKLNELISSIKEKGVVQPVLVRKNQDGYELIAGERRFRAVKSLGYPTIPAIVKNVADIDMLEISLIENIQREELNAVEEAYAFQKFISDFGFTQEKIAQVLGKDRSTIANTLRLLSLPPKIQEHISKGAISAGHAKALLSLPIESSQLRICDIIIEKGMSVRETENFIARKVASKRKAESRKDPQISDIENLIQHTLGTRVHIFHGKKRGRIQIEYYSNEDFNRITELLLSKKA